MNPSSRSHRRQTTRLVTGAGPYQHRIEARTGWGIEKFVRDTRSYRIVKFEAGNQTRTAADPLTDDVRNALITTARRAHQREPSRVKALARRIDEIFNPDGDYDEARCCCRRQLVGRSLSFAHRSLGLQVLRFDRQVRNRAELHFRRPFLGRRSLRSKRAETDSATLPATKSLGNFLELCAW